MLVIQTQIYWLRPHQFLNAKWSEIVTTLVTWFLGYSKWTQPRQKLKYKFTWPKHLHPWVEQWQGTLNRTTKKTSDYISDRTEKKIPGGKTYTCCPFSANFIEKIQAYPLKDHCPLQFLTESIQYVFQIKSSLTSNKNFIVY